MPRIKALLPILSVDHSVRFLGNKPHPDFGMNVTLICDQSSSSVQLLVQFKEIYSKRYILNSLSLTQKQKKNKSKAVSNIYDAPYDTPRNVFY